MGRSLKSRLFQSVIVDIMSIHSKFRECPLTRVNPIKTVEVIHFSFCTFSETYRNSPIAKSKMTFFDTSPKLQDLRRSHSQGTLFILISRLPLSMPAIGVELRKFFFSPSPWGASPSPWGGHGEVTQKRTHRNRTDLKLTG